MLRRHTVSLLEPLSTAQAMAQQRLFLAKRRAAFSYEGGWIWIVWALLELTAVVCWRCCKP